ncbi:LppA family lipoprotein, partial [Mycobacterium tuberculosis]|uniref:LppA family lipoprotein n=2 Tax=Mycobacterium tuberculosis TaxID=1773 RepID=UPI000AECD6C7
ARSRSSGGYLLDEPPDMTPSFPRTGVSGHAGAVQIVTELAPVFKAAGFRPNNSVPGDPPQPLGAPNYSQIRDDGVTINLVNGDNRGPLGYSYNTGCHLPAAWRTAPPPLNMRPANDPDVHYPYLYGSPGGRTRDAY